jgi:hypothetical protein
MPMMRDEIIRLIDQGLTMRARELLLDSRVSCERCGASWPVARDYPDQTLSRCASCVMRWQIDDYRAQVAYLKLRLMFGWPNISGVDPTLLD